MKNVSTLKSECRYFEAGAAAAKLDWGRNTTEGREYGIHFGMRSTRAAAITEYQNGYDRMKQRLADAASDIE